MSWAQTSLSETFPSGWIYAQGALFILVVAFLPGGLAELFTRWRRSRATPVPDDGPTPAGDAASEDARPGGGTTAGGSATAGTTAVDHDPATTGRTA
ncbi:inner-membrane translocator [Mycobacteroides abscessus]|nr:inner-membrane translocator [Mycobacteroides abscessus]